MSADDIDIAELLTHVTEAAVNAAAEAVTQGLGQIFHRDLMTEAFSAVHVITGAGANSDRRHQDLIKAQTKAWEQLADAHYRGLRDMGREIADAIRSTT